MVLVDSWPVTVWIATEGHVQIFQEFVASGQKGLRGIGFGIDGWLTIEDDNTVSKIGCHDEIVLDDKSRFLGMHDETLDDSCSDDTLLRVQVGAGFINYIDISWDAKSENYSNTLQFTTGKVLDFLVDEVINIERLIDVGLELRRQESCFYALEEQLSNSTLEFRCDFLWFHADVHRRDGCAAIWFLRSSKHFAKCCFPGPVLSHHYNDFRIGEFPRLDGEMKATQGLFHLWVAKSSAFVGYEVVPSFRDTEGKGFFAESQVLCGDVPIQENVDAFPNRRRKSDDTIHSWPAIEYANKIGKVIQDRQIVLNYNDVVVWSEKFSDNTSRAKTLLDIQVGRWLVEHVSNGC